ncbi:MAG: tRNA (N6-isopentenyl adenosine(37)-C2)-methylthiotransferase MiaB, partial [Acidobacteriota bacterium]|nr:tRNA (N6-isopentenyl adenosine(37)-C2)-methylthiotransferase MiaB [Acidobacteriota bacterium]
MSGRYYIETWGCQMNEVDSQRLGGQLMEEGFLPCPRPEEADLILLNSCSVREKAAQKVYSRLGEYRRLKHQREKLVIGLCGCVAQQEGQSALKRVPDLDFVLGTGRISEIREVVRQAREGRRPVAIGFPKEAPYEFDSISREGTHKGMVTVIEGCDKRCTFCIVPTTRGPERSRPLDAILQEVRQLLDLGFVEIELLGQTVNHWRGSADPVGRTLDFADLLDAVATLPGLQRLRFLTSYPRDFSSRMVEAIGTHPTICPYLHLPVQSGSDAVLRRMGRGYVVSEYLELVAELRTVRPDIALSTDIIVGFPGESDRDFEATIRLLEDVRFSSVYAFKYSPRPGTAALMLGDDIALETADRRLQALFRLQSRIQLEINRELVGRSFEALITSPGKEPGTMTGRTPCHRVVHFPGDPLVTPTGTLVDVTIERA